MNDAQVAQSLARIEGKVDRFLEKYEGDMNGHGAEPGVKTMLALADQRINKHSRDIDAVREEQKARNKLAVGVAASIGVALFGLIMDRVFGGKTANAAQGQMPPRQTP